MSGRWYPPRQCLWCWWKSAQERTLRRGQGPPLLREARQDAVVAEDGVAGDTASAAAGQVPALVRRDVVGAVVTRGRRLLSDGRLLEVDAVARRVAGRAPRLLVHRRCLLFARDLLLGLGRRCCSGRRWRWRRQRDRAREGRATSTCGRGDGSTLKACDCSRVIGEHMVRVQLVAEIEHLGRDTTSSSSLGRDDCRCLLLGFDALDAGDLIGRHQLLSLRSKTLPSAEQP